MLVLENFNGNSTIWGFPAMDSRDFDGYWVANLDSN